MFYPRGGSSQVVRYLVPALEARGLAGRARGRIARRAGRPPARGELLQARAPDPGRVRRRRAGPRARVATLIPSPCRCTPPSRTARGRPTGCSPRSRPRSATTSCGRGQSVLAGAWAEPPSVLHLHHLTPIHDAATALFPGTPLVTHLHGTEILLLEQIDRLSAIARSLGTDLAGMADGPPAGWEADEDLSRDERHLIAETRWECWVHGEHWSRRLRAAAARSDRVVAISPHLREEAAKVLALPPERLLSIPNGVDVSRFEQLAPAGARSGWLAGATGSSRHRRDGTNREPPARSPTATRTCAGSSPGRTAGTRRCCSSSAGSRR